MELVCEHCDKSFEAKRSKRRFCSKQCWYSFQRQANRVDLECSLCGEVFKRRESKVEQTKNDFYFCSSKCRQEGMRVGGVEEALPEHYGTGRVSQRKRLLREVGKCERCEWGRAEEVLEVHHKNRNPQDNSPKNLELLCPTCHNYEHYTSGDGSFSN